MTRSRFEKGFLDSLEATVVIPYPGTPLFRDCQEQGLLRTEDWDLYDMRMPIMESPIPPGQLQPDSIGNQHRNSRICMVCRYIR